MIGVSILHLKRECAAGRVEAVDRIAGNERELIDGILRDEVPIDDVAKDLVDTNSILVNGEPLWSADHRGSDVTAIIEISLKLVASLAAQGNARQRSVHRLQKIGRLRVFKSRSPNCLDVGRDFILVDRAGYGFGGGRLRGRRSRSRGSRGRRRTPGSRRPSRWWRDRGCRDDVNFGKLRCARTPTRALKRPAPQPFLVQSQARQRVPKAFRTPKCGPDAVGSTTRPIAPVHVQLPCRPCRMVSPY